MSYPISAEQAYYTAARSGKRIAALTGPFDSHREAAADLDRARRLTGERYPLDMLATFADYGVVLTRRGIRTAFAGTVTR